MSKLNFENTGKLLIKVICVKLTRMPEGMPLAVEKKYIQFITKLISEIPTLVTKYFWFGYQFIPNNQNNR